MNGKAAIAAAVNTPSQRRLAPDMNSIAPRMATKTREVPRSGWSSTSANGGATSTPAPTIDTSEPMCPERLAR